MNVEHQQATVLVTGTGGAAGLAVLRSLAAQGHRVLCADCDPYASGLYLVDASARIVVPRGDDPAFAASVLEEACLRGAECVIPTVDEELEALARTRDAFAAAGIALVLSPADALAVCLDKWSLVSRLASVVPVPFTALLDGGFDARPEAYPLVVKPRRGRGGRGVAVLDGPEDLARYPRDASMIVQEFLPGEEYSVDVLVDARGTAVATVPRLRVRVDSGVAVAARTVRDAELVRLGAWAATGSGIRGPANVQFRRDRQGTPRLLEINPRFPGTVAVTIAAGVDLPAAALADAMGWAPAPRPAAYREVAIVRYLEEVTVPVSEFGVPQSGSKRRAVATT